MTDDDQQSVLFIHWRDLSTPVGSTVPHYVTKRLAESHTVHVVCRWRPDRRDRGDAESAVEFHDIYTGEVTVVSGVLFVVLSTLYAVILAAFYRYDVVYAFQGHLVRGWAAARCGRSRSVVALQSVPARQSRDLVRSSEADQNYWRTLGSELRRLYVPVIGWLLTEADAVICLTDGIREVTEKRFDVNLSDAHLIGMGIDTERFAPEDPVRDGGPPDERWILTYVGTVHETRGLDHVIEALSRTDHEVELQIAGDGPADHMESLERTAGELGVSDRVKYLGLVPHEEIPELLQSTDIAVSPLADIESYRISFPAKLLEYMAAGTIVIATDIPPHRRLIDHRENGFLYDGGAPGFLCALDECIEAQTRHASIRREAMRAAAEHDWDAIVRKHEQIIVG